ncbi:ATP-binding protein [Desulfobaculum bizertense]|uniref:histidine kinase n=1 Tax=Desulfobaculum bizertense DSM 18034 TaxID=1121442 RepID=A0A1T4VD16_9BACT|nr:ATP-binding protein [Desulfobaculum bizertense]SKA62817.1 PAS domain S-box-containing protein [Desulfobaculum bizertense DSM 18034]
MKSFFHKESTLGRALRPVLSFLHQRFDPYGERPLPGIRQIARMRFKDKINIGISSVIIFFSILTAVLVSQVAVDRLLEENRDRGRSMVLNMASRAVDPLLASDFLRLKNLVDGAERLSDFTLYAFVTDKRGNVLVHTFNGGFPTDLLTANSPKETEISIQLLDDGSHRIYDFAAPVMVDGKVFGSVRLGVSQARVQEIKKDVVSTIFLVSFAVMVVAILLGTIFSRNVSARLNALRKSAESVVQGQLNVQTGPRLYRNCWDIQQCGQEDCPAYGDNRRRCWYLAGTLCPQCKEDSYPEKLMSCHTCPVYLENMGDEIQSLAETFDVMAMSLKSHIEELEQTQDDLKRQRELLRTILDVTPDLMCLLDTDFKYMTVNKAFCTYFHLNEEDLLGHSNYELFDEDEADAAYHENKQVLLTGKPISKQELIRSGDQKRWFHVIKVPVKIGKENIGMLYTARDITIIKQYQERLIHSQKMEDLGKLAGGVAHEINTPLGIILGYAQLLLEDTPGDSQLSHDLKTIEKQTKVCKKIVADLLGFSRRIESSMAPLDLNESLEEVISLLEQIFLQERVRIETDFDPTVMPITGDKEKLKQVWMNLLNNAFDAIGSDGGIYVTTKMCSHRRRVLVTVADTGSGVSQHDINNIFDPFFTTKPVGKGTGLGLALSFGIISDHGGRISAISPAPLDYIISHEEEVPDSRPPGLGTLFMVELPLTKEGLPDEECPEITEVRSRDGEYFIGGSTTWRK